MAYFNKKIKKILQSCKSAVIAALLWPTYTLPQVHFQFTANTGENGIIAIPAAVAPGINNVALVIGDEIGAFNPFGLCVGAVVWTGANLALTVWGDDPTTPVVDGLLVNDAISFRLWIKATDTECALTSSHFSDHNHLYLANCIKELDSLNGFMILVKTKIFLQGPFVSGPTMTTTLQKPLTSPYADAPRTITAVPSGIVDWIWIGLSAAPAGPILSCASFLLRSDGNIVDMDGTTQELKMPVLGNGAYYLHIKHRNHSLARSSMAVSLNAGSCQLYDFTLSAGYYLYGKAVQLTSGIWGVAAGDLYTDSFLTTRDYVIIYNACRSGQTGYDQADLNLDGLINEQDLQLLCQNIQLDVPVDAAN